jgi:NDP-sugar pyrophosphorylase family protein
MLNITIPMAGSGSRFEEAGYMDPKPFIQVGKRRMVEWVIGNLMPASSIEHRFVFIAQEAHLRERRDEILKFDERNKVIAISGLTDGAASTVYLAKHLIEGDDPLVIANSDQYVDIDINVFYDFCLKRDADGVILTFETDGNPKWSYVSKDQRDRVVEVAEKRAISYEATAGIYYFRRGHDFIRGVDSMRVKDLRVNGELYVAPTYNELIEEGRTIRTYLIPSGCMHGLGTPADLQSFLKSDPFRRANS